MGTRKWPKLLLRIAVSATLLALLLHREGGQKVLENLSRLSPWFVLFAWVFYAGCQWLSAWRWHLLLLPKQIDVPISKLFRFYMVGMFLNNFMPGAVGGDVVKAYYLYRWIKHGNYAVISVFLERFTGLIGLTIISVVTLLFGYSYIASPIILYIVAATSALLVAIVVVLWCEPISDFAIRSFRWLLPAAFVRRLHELYAALAGYRRHGGTLLTTIAISVVIQLLFAVYYALASQALGIPIDIIYFMLFLPPVTLLTMIPISLGGLGVREGVMIFLFSRVGVSAADILAISLSVHVLNTLLSVWGGLLLLGKEHVPKVAMFQQDA